ncbi:hypothetical protein [Adhaeretor mobilis]|uniref:Uncharacterized protein n=1 Tax=Adhaeretor mobilis TaxID=1930276 RepID=A0A517MR46_9BACT|nr:hypothetical protein [Adhaeretor mobilis]QDS97350.1 hypothetical protein HG15A2_06110 [Adhaeretor mobilis]
MQHPRRNLFLLAIIALLLVGGYLFYTNNRFVPPAVPNPNGYEVLLEAAKQLHPRTGWYYESTDEERATIIATNKPVLELARRGLEMDSVVPINWTAPDMQGHLDQLSGIRELARAFSAARYAAQAAGNRSVAVQNGADMLRLANHSYQGGLLVDLLVGFAIQNMGLDSLAKIVDEMDRDSCEELLREIEQLDFEPGVIEKAMTVDAQRAKIEMGAATYFLAAWQSSAITAASVKSTKVAFDRVRSLHKQLQLRIALRLFLLDNQRLPEVLAELEPEYMQNGLDDLLSDKPFVYRPADESYELYSVGPNGNDDGGPNDDETKSDDVRLDTEEFKLEASDAKNTELRFPQ